MVSWLIACFQVIGDRHRPPTLLDKVPCQIQPFNDGSVAGEVVGTLDDLP
jgi:hypothetical protein